MTGGGVRRRDAARKLLKRGLLPSPLKAADRRALEGAIFAGICQVGRKVGAYLKRGFPWTQAATQPSNEFDCLGLASQKDAERSHGITVVCRPLSVANRRQGINPPGCFTRRAWHAKIHETPLVRPAAQRLT
jgi:hypothetical protein